MSSGYESCTRQRIFKIYSEKLFIFFTFTKSIFYILSTKRSYIFLNVYKFSTFTRVITDLATSSTATLYDTLARALSCWFPNCEFSHTDLSNVNVVFDGRWTQDVDIFVFPGPNPKLNARREYSRRIRPKLQ